ncbi:hypothetical protein BH20BAC1_BH20BAC1_22660 [soil metagenome]
MSNLKISLVHGDITKIACSIVFVKHIEGDLSKPERAINEKVEGRLSQLYNEKEHENEIMFQTGDHLPFPLCCSVIFHRNDLPFSYSSVDTYARKMLQISRSANDSKETVHTIATAVHGPGAGLDGSEALETMLMGLASEFQQTKPGELKEIVFAEHDKDIFQRLQERLKYLLNCRLISFRDGDYYLGDAAIINSAYSEPNRVKNLVLNHIFIAMPYAREFNNLYYFGIKQTVERLGRKCERVDQEKFTGDVVQRIKERISSSKLVIADLTGNNPNVFYEVGFADGCGKNHSPFTTAGEYPF